MSLCEIKWNGDTLDFRIRKFDYILSQMATRKKDTGVYSVTTGKILTWVSETIDNWAFFSNPVEHCELNG